MLLIPCPYCGDRPEIEFTHGGQAHLVRPAQPADLDDQAWAEFLYMRTNTKGIHAERWRHARGCGQFFNALRDTTTDHFLAIYKTGTRAARDMNEFRNARGGRIDRAQPLNFRFDGEDYQGFAGDTLASALLANGVHLVGRSFKYHRPRGILSAGAEEPNALVTVIRDAARTTPNLRATQVELYEGLIAESQNRWPSLKLDFGRINDALSAFFPAGFYYKTFMWPKKAWKALYEPAIRRAAGLGRAPDAAGSRSICAPLCTLRGAHRRFRSRGPCGGSQGGRTAAPASYCANSRANSAAACSPPWRRSTASRRPRGYSRPSQLSHKIRG